MFTPFNQIVPIPMVTKICRLGCCNIRFCPLVIAFGRTIHTFQGQEAGPGKPIEKIIVNPGKRSFETLNPGTLYCSITRATTIGDDNNNSAIYFIGENINDERLKKMIYGVNGKMYEKVKLRKLWIEHLKKRNFITKRKYSYFGEQEFARLKENLEYPITLQHFDTIVKYHVNEMIK